MARTFELTWDPDPPKPEPATGNYSTNAHINLDDWRGNLPSTVGLTVHHQGTQILNKPVDIQVLRRGVGHGQYPLTDLIEGQDYKVEITTGGLTVIKLLCVRKPEKESRDDKRLKSFRRDKDLADAEFALNEAKAKLEVKPPTPTKLILQKNGDDGKYTLIITALSEREGKTVGVPNVPLDVDFQGQLIREIPNGAGTMVRISTGIGGKITVPLPNFKEREKWVTVTVDSVIGAGVSATIKLLGPWQTVT
ncbi:MAG: hypothetical protein HYW65_01625 [Candidatus Liptonbacteria bacterium]|nr:hypothetical protein [Candidatus Liptonbacteria bacterium]